MRRHSVRISGRRTIRICLATSVLLLLPVFLGTCGLIADPERRKVAEMDGKVIRAGDLMRIIRNMTDEERPLIQNKGDLLRALNKYIDDTIKDEIAERLVAEGKIDPHIDVATARYLERNPEFQVMWQSRQSNADRELLEKNLNYNPGDFDAMIYAVELGIEDETIILLRKPALAYVANEAFNEGTLTIAPAEYGEEYAMREHDLVYFETIEFRAIRFPVTVEGASGQASQVAQKVKAGASFSQIVEDRKARDAASVLEAVFENDPGEAKFKLFWERMTHSKRGDIVGPIFLAPHTEEYDGQEISVPGAFLVLEVLARQDGRRKSLEEARPDMAIDILSRKMMQRLREERGVAIFSEGLPNPAGFGDQYKDSIIKTRIDE